MTMNSFISVSFTTFLVQLSMVTSKWRMAFWIKLVRKHVARGLIGGNQFWIDLIRKANQMPREFMDRMFAYVKIWCKYGSSFMRRLYSS